MTGFDNRNLKIYFLTFLVILHGIFSFAGTISVISYTFNLHFLIVDILVLTIVVSFLLFRRCVMIDIYYYFKNLFGITDLPEYAKDNYPRNLFKKLIGRKPSNKDLTELRLDIISNLKPFVQSSEEKMKILMGRKFQYITMNLLLTFILISKYKVKFLVPLVFVWIFIVFGI
ncbi:MAG TPA: hypothetical protein V6C58_12215 [Allocoleopsis sp.]